MKNEEKVVELEMERMLLNGRFDGGDCWGEGREGKL